jgi:hypothetical protein
MKKMLRFLVPMFLVNAIGVFAVVWPVMDSNPFTFKGVGVAKTMNVSQARLNFHCGSINNGVVTLRYQLPYGVNSGMVKIYNLRGNQIASFNVNANTTSIQWSSGKGKITSGVYMAALRYGSNEEKIKFSILQ